MESSSGRPNCPNPPNIHDVARGGFVDLLKNFLNEKDINARNKIGMTALHIAVLYSRVECVRLLLDAGIDVNAVTIDHQTALSLICSVEIDGHMRRRIAQMLLESGASPNIQGEFGVIYDFLDRFEDEHYAFYGFTVLNKAIWLNDPGLVKLLLDHEADVNAIDKICGSSCNAAASVGSLEILKMILNQDLTFDMSSRENCTFFKIVACNPRRSGHLLPFFLKNEKCCLLINHQDFKGRTALFEAARTVWCEGINQLLDSGADPNLKLETGELPLHIATFEFPDIGDNDEGRTYMRLFSSTDKHLLPPVYEEECLCFENSLYHLALGNDDKIEMLKFLIANLNVSPSACLIPLDHFDYFYSFFYGDIEELGVDTLSFWCKRSGKRDLNIMTILLEHVENINSIARGRVPPLLMVCNDSDGFDGFDDVKLLLAYKLLQSGADVLIKIRPSDPLPTAFFFAIMQRSPVLLMYLLWHCVPAEVVFYDESFARLLEFITTRIANLDIHAFSMEFAVHLNHRFTFNWLVMVMQFLPMVTYMLTKFVCAVGDMRVQRNAQENRLRERAESSEERTDDSDDYIPHFPHSCLEIPPELLKILMDSCVTPKSLRSLCALKVRRVLWEARKGLISESIEKLCADMNFSVAIKKLLFLGIDKHWKWTDGFCVH